MWRVHVDSLELPSMIITNNDNCLPFQFAWKPSLHPYMGVPFSKCPSTKQWAGQVGDPHHKIAPLAKESPSGI